MRSSRARKAAPAAPFGHGGGDSERRSGRTPATPETAAARARRDRSGPEHRPLAARTAVGMFLDMAEPGAEPVVDIYTDGACSGNPGPGDGAQSCAAAPRTKEIYGGEPTATTDNRMGVGGPNHGVGEPHQAHRRAAAHRQHYVRDGITKWLPRWTSNGWQTTGKQPVKNADLWLRLDTATRPTRCTGTGSRATPDTRTTNAPINWPPPAYDKRAQPQAHPSPPRQLAEQRHAPPPHRTGYR